MGYYASKSVRKYSISSLSLISIYRVLDNYYLSFPSDPIIRKALVCLIWTLETLHLVLVTQDIYRIFINGFGNYMVSDDLHLLPLTVAIMGGLSMGISHILLLLHTYWLYASSWTHMSSYISISCPSNIAVPGYRWVNFNSACSATSQVYCYCHDLTHISFISCLWVAVPLQLFLEQSYSRSRRFSEQLTSLLHRHYILLAV